MTVGYNKTIAVVILVLGAGCLLLGIAAAGYSSGVGRIGPIFAGAACIMNGLLMLSRPMFSLEADRVVLHALLGPLKRNYPFASKRDLTIRNNRLYVGDKKLPVGKGRCDAGDWEKLVATLTFE